MNALRRAAFLSNCLKSVLFSFAANKQQLATFHFCKGNANSLLPGTINHIPFFPSLNLSCGLKYKDVLTKRCEGCYFKKIEDRWYVFCDKHPRHKQAQKMDIKEKYIITHITHGKKKY